MWREQLSLIEPVVRGLHVGEVVEGSAMVGLLMAPPVHIPAVQAAPVHMLVMLLLGQVEEDVVVT